MYMYSEDITTKRKTLCTDVEDEVEQEGHHARDEVEVLQVVRLDSLQRVRVVVHLLVARRDL